MSDLFKIEPTPSPRLAWMRKHNVRTHKAKCVADDDEPWMACVGDVPEAFWKLTYKTGRTEDDAIVELAKLNGWLLWNEET